MTKTGKLAETRGRNWDICNCLDFLVKIVIFVLEVFVERILNLNVQNMLCIVPVLKQ